MGHQDVRRVTENSRFECHHEPGTSIGKLDGSELQGSRPGSSKAEFVAKLGIVVEEADETVFWLEMLADGGIVPRERMRDMLDEANRLMLIFSASRRTAKA